MRTDKQIEASRANGARSRGPVTPAGKWNSSHSSRNQKILARTIVLQTEDPRQFCDLLSDFSSEFQPGTPFELSIIETIAIARWEQQRLRCARKVAIDLQIQNEPTSQITYPHAGAAITANAICSVFASSRALDALYREDARLEREIQRAIQTLFAVQSRRGFQPQPWSPATSGPELTPAAPAPAAEPDPEPVSTVPADYPDSDPSALLGFLPANNFPASDPNNPLKTQEATPSPIPAAPMPIRAADSPAPAPPTVPVRAATASAACGQLESTT
jgi:hypothetical protein